MNTFSGPFGKDFWTRMQPDHYSSAGISSIVKERPVLFTHYTTTGPCNDWAPWSRKTLAQNF
jgi:hypothetical protein